MPAPLFIILNAGSGHAETELQRTTIEDLLTAAGREFELAVLEQAGELAGIAKHMAARARDTGGVLVAAGGDGTINTVARAAVDSGCQFGVLPQGTFNYFGRTHQIPEDLAEAVQALLTARVEPVQVGLVNDKVFLVNASIGLYPKLLEEREIDKKQYGRSRLVALLSALKTVLGSYRHLHITVELNSKMRTLRTSTLFVGNNRLQMEQVGIAPLAERIEDGKLAALAPQVVGKFGMLALLLRGALGRLGDAPNLHAFGLASMTVRQRGLVGRRRIKVAIDGEVTHLDAPLVFRVLEGQLLLLKPVAAAGAADQEPLALAS
ncbi:diacylglycerol/lipid kinase family protein [Massilia scottii]|uniref:diacylglycerol/lipid kinase family protein n=1 Tax=Massilia scottii TaxID=3057166 RepID=UPI0027966C36|nr:diacylglycerol kinase family protein [Massilia sp. CCM 9029]MDQ1830387.1 diacylglycerol kinase family protein [Massilia sp. CCM 9029]